MTVKSSIINREDTAANWTSNNPTLESGVYGHETDTGFIKKGDGATAWTSLAYLTTAGAPIETNLEQPISSFYGSRGVAAITIGLLTITSGATSQSDGQVATAIGSVNTSLQAIATYCNKLESAIKLVGAGT
jgi:hypothetical protein